MLTDLDRLLTESLHQRAETGAPIDPARLMNAAVDKGRRIRTRRRLTTTAVAAVVVFGIFLTGLLVPRRSDPTTPPPDDPQPTGSAQVAVNLARLPAAVGQPGAGARPDLVGTDATVVHMSIDALADQALFVRLESGPGYEIASVDRPDFDVVATLSRSGRDFPGEESLIRSGRVAMSSPTAIVVDGVAGTLSSAPVLAGLHIYSITWRMAGGLWVNVEAQTTTQERALELIGMIRFDQARRCALPFRIEHPPTSGSKLETCSVRLNSDRQSIFMMGSLFFTDGKRRLQINASENVANGGDYPRDLPAGPYKVFADPDGRTWTMNVWPVYFDAIMVTRKKPYTQQQVLDVLGSVKLAADYQDPQTW